MNAETLLFNLRDAFNAHDMTALMDCFSENYQSEQPVHPDRSFQGRDEVKKNWGSNFDDMRDFSAQLVRYAINQSTIWAEWEWQGTRQDKSKLLMRGVTIMVVEDGKIVLGRLFVEPVEAGGKGIEAAVEEVMHGKKMD